MHLFLFLFFNFERLQVNKWFKIKPGNIEFCIFKLSSFVMSELKLMLQMVKKKTNRDLNK